MCVAAVGFVPPLVPLVAEGKSKRDGGIKRSTRGAVNFLLVIFYISLKGDSEAGL